MQWFTQRKICNKLNIKNSQVDYIVRDRLIDLSNVITKGKGRKRKFNEKALKEIEDWLNK